MRDYKALASSIAARSAESRARLGQIEREAMNSRKAWRSAAETGSVEIARRNRVKQAAGSCISGFFPTPRPVVLKMVEWAEMREGLTVLEPSAGAGHIAKEIHDCDLTLVEINSTLCRLLHEQGFKPIQADFLTWQTDKHFDRILMNPPFELLQDIAHVQKAFSLLAPKGILVSIMGAGAFFRSDRTATGFRSWLEEIGAEKEKLPAGAFNLSENPTGVQAYIVKIRAECKNAM